MLRLRRIVPAFAEHVASYGDLIYAAIVEWKGSALRRLVLAFVGLTLAVSAVVVACGWLLASVWDQPARHWVAAALVAVLALGAVAVGRRATASVPGPHQARLRAEWQQDLALLAEVRDQ